MHTKILKTKNQNNSSSNAQEHSSGKPFLMKQKAKKEELLENLQYRRKNKILNKNRYGLKGIMRDILSYQILKYSVFQ